MAISADKVVECDPCQDRKAVSYCKECREFYCTECSSLHQSFKVTRKHIQVYINTVNQKHTSRRKTVHCEPCRETKKIQSATSICLECRELYCHKCSTYHGKIMATRDHMIFQLSDENRSDISGEFDQLRISSPKPDFSGAQVRKDTVVDKSPSNMKVKSVDVTDKSLKLTYCKEFSPRIPSDTKEGLLDVKRMLTLPDDRIVMLDGVNDKLKLFSADYQIIHYCDVHKYFSGLTSVDDTTLAVSRDNMITLNTRHRDRIQKSKSIKHDMDGDMYDICYKDNKFVCPSYHADNKWCIDVVDIEGHSKTIVSENGRLYIFNHIIIGDNNCFYINTNTDKMRCLTLDGRQLWVVSGIPSPRGMSLVRGKLLVVEYGKGEVRQISLDGKLHDQPALQDLYKPHCICYQQKRNKILLSSCKPGSPIKVYQVD